MSKDSISKSQYLMGIRCEKSLWLYRNKKYLKSKLTDSKKTILNQGHEVGYYAKKYFENGIEVSCDYFEIQKAIKVTKEYIANGVEVIYEACSISKDGIYSKIDILKKSEISGWDLIEVKGSTSPKDYYFDDMASQRYAFERSGYDINKSYLMILNNQYIRHGEVDARKLFKLVDCTDEVLKRIENVENNIQNFKNVISSKIEPDMNIGRFCNIPFECDFKDYCWKDVPEFSVFNLFAGSKLDRLTENGVTEIEKLEEVDVTSLSEIKKSDLNSYINNQIVASRSDLERWVKKLEYPLYFLDYETIGLNSPIPPFDNTKPYDVIPFQFSLHIKKTKSSELEHCEFIHKERNDPRYLFIQNLLQYCKCSGSIISYNSQFEIGVNNKLAELFPEYCDELNDLNSRMVDMLVPFRKRYLYHPRQNSSASIKAVLPAFIPELSYDDLDISDGSAASRMYTEFINGGISTEAEMITFFKSLSDYCSRDTIAMVRLLEVIYSYIK